jgi:macrolide transport system ATP-binding/permease protein
MRLYALLLHLFPPSFRRTHGAELLQVARTARQRGEMSGPHLAIDLLQSIAREWLHLRAATSRRPRGSIMHDLARDVRYAARLLLKQPGFTTAAIATLALGIGANTAIFSLAEATLLRPIKVAAPERLVSWTWTSAYRDYLEFTQLTDTFDGVLAWSGGSRVNLVIDGPSELATSMFLSGNAFGVLGVGAAVGRVILPTDDVRNGPVVGVVSYDFWRSRFGGDPRILGRRVQINNQPVTIVGVAQQGFRGVTLGITPAIYLPVTAAGQIRGGFFNRPQVYETRNFVWLNVIGRLRDGVTREQASSVVETVYYQLDRSRPAAPTQRLTLQPMTTRALSTSDPESIERFVLLLIGVVALTLLIGCANLANLLLAKTASRRQEVGIRLAVGANRSRVVRQLIVESVLLSMIGAVAGLAVAALTLRLLATYQLPGGISIGALDLSLDRWTLVATAGLALATGLLFGTAPAWHVSRTDVMIALRDATSAGSSPTRIRNGLVAAEVAISLVLLAGSGLFLRSLVHALAIPTGFDANGVATASVNPGLVRFDEARVRTFYGDALARVGQLPGVTAAAWTNIIPSNGLMMNVVDIEGGETRDGDGPTFYVSHVTPDYFAAAGTRLLKGRPFTAQDTSGAPLVAIISRTAAEKFWPDRDPIGLKMKPGGQGDWRTIVGIAEDVVVQRLDEVRVPYVFYPFDQASGGLRSPGEPAHLLVRTTGNPDDLLATLSALLRSIDSQMPVYDVMPFTEHVRELVMPQRMGVTLMALFSVLAVSLAALGIYGVASYVALVRTRELGIRIALGADAHAVRRLVLQQGVAPAACGVIAGVALALWAARFARAFLYDVSTTDPLTFTLVPSILLLISVAATWLPARRAVRIDPVTALRDQ